MDTQGGSAPVDFSAVPEALRTRAQWLCWRLEEKPGAKKPAKMPYYASGRRRTGEQGSEADRAALVTFDAAVAAMAAIKADGVGFAFLPGDGLIGIDLDKMVDAETGEVSPRAQRIIEACASYTEWSPSGNGFHIYVLGETGTAKDNGIGVEMFCGRQFFTVTGRHLQGTPREVATIPDKVLRRLHKTIEAAKGGFSDKPPPSPPSPPKASPPPLSAQGMSERERVLSALDAIDPALGYDEWVQVGMALHSSLGADGFSSWDAWSARSEKYPGRNTLESHWKSFKPGRVGVGTLYHLAKQNGWKPPRRAPGSKRLHTPSQASAGEGEQPDDFRWRFSLWRNDAGNPRAIRENVVVLLAEHPKLKGLVAHNVFANRIEKRSDPPWGGGLGEWRRQDTSELADYVAHAAGMMMKLKDVSDAVSLVAWRQQVNPVRELLESLPPWDGVDRLDFWLSECLGAQDKPYTRLVGRKYLMGMVKRVLDPGCKFDYMLILEGDQGRGKSSTFRVLAWREDWYNDTPFSANLDKDARLALHGCWLYEIPELHGFNKADTNAVKAFVTQMEDRLRAPYAEQHETFKRTLVFGGSTNETEYFRDRTGNRRFWPVAILLADLDKLKEWRPQLFAEALHRVRAGESVFPCREEETLYCLPEQRQRLVTDPWQDFITDWLGKLGNEVEFLTYVDLLRDCLKVDPARIDPHGEMGRRLRYAMDALGWYQDRARVGGHMMRGFKKRTVDLKKEKEVEESGTPF
ncbi:MAG: hypothetical protein B6D47_12950 [Rhodocyclaceae bacterium UTPRO2]|jgi:predicted P-loop ATPase|nr:MAG: hypothetical protein B6D47_12950 [Rhodocyclaceae bacterium UTPRO2]